ncbi:TPA: Inositol polyphosphate phosphatase-like 1b [Trebouxia sp. C0004]
MLVLPSYTSTAPHSPEEHQKLRILQPKTSNISVQKAGIYGMAFADSAVSPKLQIQPCNSIMPPAQTPMSLSDTAFELHSSQGFTDMASSAAERVSEDAHLMHCLSIPGQIDLHEHGTGDGSMSEGAQPIDTPRQVQIQDRVGGSQQSAIDALAEPPLPHMVPLGDANGAAGCVNDQLANVTEALCCPNSEGPVAISLPTCTPARLTLPDPSLVNRQSSQLSPLGKKPPLCGPIDLHASTGDLAGSPAATDSKADGRPCFEPPRSSLSPAGASPSTSHHIHRPHLFGQSQPKPLRVRAVTFNMAKKMPTDLPEELLGRAGCPEGLDKYDIVVIGTQESGSSQEWNKLVAMALGAKYVKLASESLWQIRVSVYVRAKLREHITAVATSSVATGIGNVAGNKGGVGVALTYMDHTRLLFVNAHFQAHTHRVAGRQADYLRIKAGLFNNREEADVEWAPYAVDQDAAASPSRSPASKADHTSPHTRLLRDETGSVTSSESSFSLITSSFTQRLQQWAQPSIRDVADDYHVTIWLGDLNYRVETGGNRRVVDGVLKMTGLTEDERLNVLRNNDQLKKERELGKVFLVRPSPCRP